MNQKEVEVLKRKKSEIYAKALFELDSSSELLKTLHSFSEILKEEQFFSFFISASVSLEEKKGALAGVLSSCPSIFKNFFFVLLDNKAFSLFHEVAQIYQELFDEKNQICRGWIISPQKPEKEEKEEIEKLLAQFFNKKVALELKEDKKLIAGFLVDIGGYIFKGTSEQYLKNFEKLGGL